MAAREKQPIEVTGPGCEGRPAPNEGAGISLALHYATHAGEPGSWYVREHGELVRRVDRNDDGSCSIVAAGGSGS